MNTATHSSRLQASHRAHHVLVVSATPPDHAAINEALRPGLEGSPPAGNEADFRFQVQLAINERQALEHLESAQQVTTPFALAFVALDVVPQMDPIALARELWQRQASLQIIFIGGETDAARKRAIQTFGTANDFLFLRRPMDALEVRQLARMLTRKLFMGEAAAAQLREMNEVVAGQTSMLTAANEQLRAEIRLRGKIEMELRGSEHRFQLAFKASAIPMAIMHTSTNAYLEVNEGFARLVGLPKEAIVNRSPKELNLLADPRECVEAMDLLRRVGRVRDHSIRITPHSGEPRDTLVSLESVVLGEEPCVLVAMLDVTEKRKLEMQLRQSQKMDAIGQLAAGVAHDFNNLLTIIHGHTSLEMSRCRQDEQTHHSLLQVKQAADRAATLTRQLLTFSRKQVMQFRPTNLNSTIQQAEDMLRRLLGETIQLECVCEPDLAPVMADPNSMGQVIMNLAVNARDAMPGGGHLQITTRRVHLKPEHVTHQPDARPGLFARLTVADTGCGMDTTILARSFEPFFTTKPPGKGTGLGLSTVYGIVKQHNGWMEAESEPGKGSQFHIYLEMTNRPTEPTAEETPHVLTADGGQKQKNILVVEDEPVLREFVTQVLAAHGYGILQASDGVEALQVARQTGSEIDLLLTDMVMPNGVTGNHLATQLLAERQHLKVLFTSGYSQELMDNAERLVDGHNFLPKPFDVNRLLRTVRTCLDSQSLPLATDDALVAATN